jgi:hypothetical protein
LFSTGRIKTLARAALVEDITLARRNGPVRKRGADLANEALLVDPFKSLTVIIPAHPSGHGWPNPADEVGDCRLQAAEVVKTK